MKNLPLFLILTASLAFAKAPTERRARKTASVDYTPVLQRILNAEDQRIPDDKILLDSLTGKTSDEVKRRAITAAGRIGTSLALEPLNKIISGKDKTYKQLAITAMGLIPDPKSIVLLTQHFPMARDAEIQRWLLEAIGRAGSEKQIPFVADALSVKSDPSLYGSASLALGNLFVSNPTAAEITAPILERLAHVANLGGPAGLNAAFALARFRGASELLPLDAMMSAAAGAPDRYTQALLVRAVGRSKQPKAAAFLKAVILNKLPLPTRIEATRSLGNFVSNPDALQTLELALKDKEVGVVSSALEVSLEWGVAARALEASIQELLQNSPSVWVRELALKNLAKMNPSGHRARVLAFLGMPASPLLPAAVHSLSWMEDENDRNRLADYFLSENRRLANEALQAVSQMEEKNIPEKVRKALLLASQSNDVAVLCWLAEIAQKHRWEAFAPALSQALLRMSQTDQLEAKVAILGALGDLKPPGVDLLSTVKKMLQDPNRPVVVAAVETIKKISGEDLSNQIPLNSKIVTLTPTWREAMEATRKKAVMVTNRGSLEFQFRSDAPLTVFQFVQLAKKGFYDGKTFHRVVPNFVVQGGDPRGDGYGGPGFFIRDEVSSAPHRRFSMGIATAGKDTGGSQFFFNLSPNLHLAGKYTLFADVINGDDLIDRLEIGDKIVSIRIQ